MFLSIRHPLSSVLAGLLLLCVLFPGRALATPTTLDLAYSTYPSGQSSPGSTAKPWLEAVFTTVGQPANTVQLTLKAPNLLTGEYVSTWLFNVDSSISNILVSRVSGVEVGSTKYKQNAENPGKYDLSFSFPTSNTNDGSRRFTDDRTAVFLLSATGLTAQSFNVANAQGLSTAHIQNISGGSSTWVTGKTATPIPGAAWLLGSGVLGLIGFRRKLA